MRYVGGAMGMKPRRTGPGGAGPPDDLMARAIALLGPLEGRIMRALWTGAIAQPLVVRDAQTLEPHLAYTTMMTTLNRLAEKGLLTVEHTPGQRAHTYRAAGQPRDFLVLVSRRQAQRMRERYGEAALAAFAAELGELPPELRRKLRRIAHRG